MRWDKNRIKNLRKKKLEKMVNEDEKINSIIKIEDILLPLVDQKQLSILVGLL